MSIPQFTLKSGTKVPGIAYGLGSKWFRSQPGDLDENIVNCLKQAIAVGYVHIDIAECYNNYPEVKAGIAGVDKSKLYITDKFDSKYKIKGHNPYDTLKLTLKFLEIDHVDLYLLHAPFIYRDAEGSALLASDWADMVKLKEEGFAKEIGVSNFGVDDIKHLDPLPAANEIEFSAYLQDQHPGVVEYCQSNGILVSAYGSLAPVTQSGPLTGYLEELSKKYGKSTSEIVIRWVQQVGVLPVTTSSSADRLKGYLKVGEFSLAEDEVSKIKELGKTKRIVQYWTNDVK